MKISKLIGNALLGTCLYGAVMNSFPTNEEKDAVGGIDATNEVERAGCAAALGLKTTLGMTQGEIVAAIRGDQRGEGALASSDMEDSDLLLRRRISTAEGVAKRCLQWCASSPQETTGLDARPQWSVRGAWNDDYYQAFAAEWVFPFGTNHLSGVVVYSQGGLAVSSYDEPFVSLPIPVAIVPREGLFTVDRTSSNSTVFAWWNVRPGRTATETLDAQIELFRNGDYCVSTNGVVVEQYIRGNPHPDVPIGQDSDYREWVDEQVGVGLENGLYKFTASFPVDPVEATLLTVGGDSIVVTNAGEYVFVLEKGCEYEFETVPYDPTVEYWMQDDLADSPVFANLFWGGGFWSVDGGWSDLVYPTADTSGRCIMMPTFQGSPDVPHIFPEETIEFSAALLDSVGGDGGVYHWTSSNYDVEILSPDSQTTRARFNSTPSWAQGSVSVTGTFGTNTYESVLHFTYGENETPQAYPALSLPSVAVLNGKRRPVYVSYFSDLQDDTGTLTLRCVSGSEKVRFWTAEEGGTQITLPRSWSIASFEGFACYVQGIETSGQVDDVRLELEYSSDEAGSGTQEMSMTVVDYVCEPICTMISPVASDGVHPYMNPCMIQQGRAETFWATLLPLDCPQSWLTWRAHEGSATFPDGNVGYRVQVDGDSGFLRLRADILGYDDEPDPIEFRIDVIQEED